MVALLTPLKTKLQALVDSHFKEAQSPAQTIKSLVREARPVVQVIDTKEFLQTHLESLSTVLQVRRSALEVRTGTDLHRFLYGSLEETDTEIGLPLLRHGEELGRLELGPRESGRPYTQEERDALQESAELLAQVISLSGQGWRDLSGEVVGLESPAAS